MPTGNYISLQVNQQSIMRVFSQLAAYDRRKRMQISQEVATSTYVIEGGAKRLAPVAGKRKFGGRLRSSIHSQIRTDGLGGRIWVEAFYAPFQEFGTGVYVDVPPGFEAFALQFKGKGIRQVNIIAKHFLWDAFTWEVPRFFERIQAIVSGV
jgi:hypothetical protein